MTCLRFEVSKRLSEIAKTVFLCEIEVVFKIYPG